MNLSFFVTHRTALQQSTDALGWVVGIVLATGIVYQRPLAAGVGVSTIVVVAIALAIQAAAGSLFHLYRGRYRFGSFEEVAGLAMSVGATTAVVALVNVAWPGSSLLRPHVPMIAGVIALLSALGVRYAWRLFLERHHRPSAHTAEPVLVFGAGDGGDQAIAAMLRDRAGRYLPVGLLDDDPRKQNLRLRGIPVMGGRTRLSEAASATGAKTVVIAIPTADAALIAAISQLAASAGLATKVLPRVSELIDGRVYVDDIRDLDVADLLGRNQIELDLESIADYLTGKRVLVTGAGGSIGSELCRQIAQFAPAELMMLDRDESALHAVQLSITGRALLDGDDLILADIRDIDLVLRIFEERRPQVVFHAAALKHLTLLERHPGEAVKSNVWATWSVLQAAQAVDVERFVNISTDKAADPESVLGFSKRIAERLTAHAAREADGRYLSVRFGNVLGSRGSVLTAFTAQIEAGGPVTVTHPDVTRYFMTVQEAVQLVIQAAAVGEPGEVLVLDMGEPVRIADVAQRLTGMARRQTDIVFTGLRPGEKLHEKLLADDERDVRPKHPLISQVPVPPLLPFSALELDPWLPADDIIAALRELALAPGDGERPQRVVALVLPLASNA